MRILSTNIYEMQIVAEYTKALHALSYLHKASV